MDVELPDPYLRRDFYRILFRAVPRATVSGERHTLHAAQKMCRELLAHPEVNASEHDYLEFVLHARSYQEVTQKRYFIRVGTLSPVLRSVADLYLLEQTLTLAEDLLERDLRAEITSTLWGLPADHPHIELLLRLSQETRNGIGFETWAGLAAQHALTGSTPSSTVLQVFDTWDLQNVAPSFLGAVHAAPQPPLSPPEEEIFYTLLKEGIMARQATVVARQLGR